MVKLEIFVIDAAYPSPNVACVRLYGQKTNLQHAEVVAHRIERTHLYFFGTSQEKTVIFTLVLKMASIS